MFAVVTSRLAAATAALLITVAMGASAAAAPRGSDCPDCASATGYDTAQPSAGGANEPPVVQRRDDDKRAGDTPAEECPNCPPPKKYDSQEVVKNVKDVDRSRVINTTTVVQVPPRVREKNHLVIHENQTRLTGVVQHNNLIIEKEIRYVHRYRPPVRPIRPRIVPQPVYILVPVQTSSGCGHCGQSAAVLVPAVQAAPAVVQVVPQVVQTVPQVVPVMPSCGSGYYSSCGMVLR